MRAPLALALSLSCAAPLARAQPSPRSLPEYTRRPLTLPAGQVVGRVGFGLAQSSAPPGSGGTTEALGAGVAFELNVGVWRSLEASAGVGLRPNPDGELLAADRYGRVDREEVYQVGNRLVGNPWTRWRWGLFEPSERPVRVALEALVVFPIASQTSWSVGAGVPVHVVVPAARLRVETGVFVQLVVSDTAAVRNVLNVPVRVMVQVIPRLALGVVTGVFAGNVGRDDATDARVPLGAQAAVRVASGTDLLLQWVYPTMAPFGTDAVGLGVTVAGRMR